MNALHGDTPCGAVGLTLRRDRLMLPLWIVALVATVASTISAFDDLYPDRGDALAFAASIQDNVVFRAFYGTAVQRRDPTAG